MARKMTQKEFPFPSEYNKYAVRAINAGYPRCQVCGEPIQKDLQRGKNKRCRLCIEEGLHLQPGQHDMSGGPEVEGGL